MIRYAHAMYQRARTAQLQLLAALPAIDHAVTQNLVHGAMAGTDPLTDSLYQQLDACAEEGGVPALPYAQALIEAQQDTWLWRLVPVALVLGALSACFYPLAWQ